MYLALQRFFYNTQFKRDGANVNLLYIEGEVSLRASANPLSRLPANGESSQHPIRAHSGLRQRHRRLHLHSGAPLLRPHPPHSVRAPPSCPSSHHSSQGHQRRLSPVPLFPTGSRGPRSLHPSAERAARRGPEVDRHRRLVRWFVFGFGQQGVSGASQALWLCGCVRRTPTSSSEQSDPPGPSWLSSTSTVLWNGKPMIRMEQLRY